VAYRYSQISIAGGVSGHSRLKSEAQVTVGEEPDVDNARMGHVAALRGTVLMSPSDWMNISAVTRHERLRAGATWVYRAAINDVRIEIYPRLNSRIRVIAQQNKSQRNPNGGIIDGPPRRSTFTLQALMSQRFGTRALAFAGYTGAGSTIEDGPRWPSGRSIFAKIAWDIAL
jgi:hypothetical protein